MNSPSSNSGGFARSVSPPPPHEFYLVLPDGSCIPATARNCSIIMKQARGEARKQAKIRRHEKAVEVQMALEDRAAARRLMLELAEIERDRIRYAARLRVRVRPDKPTTRTSPVEKRPTLRPTGSRTHAAGRAHAASSWVIDDRGMRGVIWQQSYLGRKSPNFYRGAARDNWEYDVRDEAVLLDAAGEPVIVSNMGVDWIEIGAGWQAMEDASTRKNAKIQIRAIAPFDADMSQEEMILALRHFCETVLEPLGLPYSAVIHRPSDGGDERNFHPHLAFSLRPMRRVEPYCWEVADEVCGELDGKDGVQMLRHLWAHSMSEAAERARSNRRYTGLGYGARGLDLEAGEHLGEGRAAMVKRGDHVWAHERNRIKNARNAARRAIRDADRKIAALTKVRDAAVADMVARSGSSIRTRFVSTTRPGIELAPLQTSRQRQGAAKETVRTASSMPAKPLRLVASNAGSRTSPGRRRPLAVSENARVMPVPIKSTAGDVRVKRIPLRSSRPRDGEASRRLVASQLPKQLARSVQSKPATTQANLELPRAIGQRASPLLASHADTRLVPVLLVRAKAAGKLDPPLVPSSQVSRTDPKLVAKIDDLLHALAAARGVRDGKRVEARDRAMAPSRSTTQQTENVSTPPMTTKSAPPMRSQSTLPVSATSTDRLQRQRLKRRWMPDDRYVSPTRTELETRGWLEAHPRTPFGATGARLLNAFDCLQLERLRTRDLYIVDYGGGTALAVDGAKAHAMGISDDWLSRPQVQQALGGLRAEQQKVLMMLSDEADRRPLDFARHGIRTWPRDLDFDDLKRLDRWAADEGFQHDMFGVEQRIRGAHDERDRQVRGSAAGKATPAETAEAIPDGFGGWSSAPAPSFTGEDTAVRAAAFDRKTGKPTDQLLMLLDLAATHPRRVVFAADGKLMVTQGAPALMPPLLHGWRHDQRIADLVVATVRASREAGKPTWPREIAPAVRAYNARGAQHLGRSPIDLSSGPRR